MPRKANSQNKRQPDEEKQPDATAKRSRTTGSKTSDAQMQHTDRTTGSRSRRNPERDYDRAFDKDNREHGEVF